MFYSDLTNSLMKHDQGQRQGLYCNDADKYGFHYSDICNVSV
jgi:hypothetical protein